MALKNTERFSNRVEDYVKYRPHYPSQIISYLRERYHLPLNGLVADIGAGTGISSALFLDAGFRVMAVEPNKEMREKAIALLQSRDGFGAIDGTAEATNLPDHSVDAVIAGQAFHWFNVLLSRKEFSRILRPDGIVALIWNERLTSSPFESEYETLIRTHGRDYAEVDHRNTNPEQIAAFFHPQPFDYQVFPNEQVFDFKGLRGRLLSSSYMPAPGEAGNTEMIHDLQALFDRYQENGQIAIHYATRLYSGRLSQECN